MEDHPDDEYAKDLLKKASTKAVRVSLLSEAEQICRSWNKQTKYVINPVTDEKIFRLVRIETNLQMTFESAFKMKKKKKKKKKNCRV